MITGITYLFILHIMAGAGANESPHRPTVEWRQGWSWSGEFASPDACQSAAKNLGLRKQGYRCITKSKGELVWPNQ